MYLHWAIYLICALAETSALLIILNLLKLSTTCIYCTLNIIQKQDQVTSCMQLRFNPQVLNYKRTASLTAIGCFIKIT